MTNFSRVQSVPRVSTIFSHIKMNILKQKNYTVPPSNFWMSAGERVFIFNRPKNMFISHFIRVCLNRIWTLKVRLFYWLSCFSQKCAQHDLLFLDQILLKHILIPWEINFIFGLLKINTLSSALIQFFLVRDSLVFASKCSLLCVKMLC